MEIISLNGCRIIKLIKGKFIVYYNISNCKNIVVPIYDEIYVNDYFLENDFFGYPNKCDFYYKVTICINLSSNCNLRCKYCFNDKSKHNEIKLTECISFINEIIDANKKTNKFFIDLSGSGEPLLYLDKIIKIADYCKKKSDEIGKEITPMLVTNGILLNEEKVNLLQTNGILFGVSLDGYKELHDLQRVDLNGNGTYEKILKNIKNIKNNQYVGGAMTVYSEKTDIFKAYTEMLSIFKTVSIRFARMDYTNFSFDYILDGYKKFAEYLLREIEFGNYSCIISIINGDDYFGKNILKIMSNTYLERRCDADLGRFSLGSDGKRYPCSACVFDEDIKELFEKNDYCVGCILEHFCGGICPIQLKRYKGNEILCNFKKQLFLIALELVGTIMDDYFDIYCRLIKEGTKIITRYLEDKELKYVYEKNKDKYTFTELKKIKDSDYSLFNEIKNNVK